MTEMTDTQKVRGIVSLPLSTLMELANGRRVNGFLPIAPEDISEGKFVFPFPLFIEGIGGKFIPAGAPANTLNINGLAKLLDPSSILIVTTQDCSDKAVSAVNSTLVPAEK